jgi:hypothetical protein
MLDEHPPRQHAHALAPRERPVYPSAAEHEQRFDVHARRARDRVALRLRLAERRAVHAPDAHRAGVALRLDREHARRADQDVVDVSVPEARVVDHAPFVARQRLEQAADVLLGARAAVAAVDERQHVARHDEHRREQRDLGREEAQVVQAERAPERGRRDGEHAERRERAQAQAQDGRARVLPRCAARRVADYVHLSTSVRVARFFSTIHLIGRSRVNPEPIDSRKKRGARDRRPKAAPELRRKPDQSRPMPIHSNHRPDSDRSSVADVCLLLRAHAESRWLSNQLVPVMREIELRDAITDEQLATALAYLEVLWIEACARARETESARVELDALGSGDRELYDKARRYHAAARRLRDGVERRVARLLAVPNDDELPRAPSERLLKARTHHASRCRPIGDQPAGP